MMGAVYLSFAVQLDPMDYRAAVELGERANPTHCLQSLLFPKAGIFRKWEDETGEGDAETWIKSKR